MCVGSPLRPIKSPGSSDDVYQKFAWNMYVFKRPDRYPNLQKCMHIQFHGFKSYVFWGAEFIKHVTWMVCRQYYTCLPVHGQYWPGSYRHGFYLRYLGSLSIGETIILVRYTFHCMSSSFKSITKSMSDSMLRCRWCNVCFASPPLVRPAAWRPP